MTQDEIEKAFNGRWNMKSKNHPEAWVKGVKELCRDFFEAGAFIAQASVLNQIDPTVQTKSITSVSEANESLAEQDFEYWWDLYNKKRGKDRCKTKWMKLSANERTACIEATPLYVQSTPDVTFRKDPYTYLHNKSWQDEVYFRPTREQQRQQRLADAANLVAKYAGADKRDKR